MTLSVVMITNNSMNYVGRALESVRNLGKEILVSDQQSTDRTTLLLSKYDVTVFITSQKNWGKRKQTLIDRATGDWILILDSDESVSDELRLEINRILKSKTKMGSLVAYRIPYQNYVLGKPIYWGGERYAKVRLFLRGYGHVTPVPIHEEVVVNGPVGELYGVIHHHSFRSIPQIVRKFTRYALLVAKEKKKKNELVTLSKLFFYGPHMFWARFIKDQGYKDGLHGFILAFAFSYMETLTYWLLLVV